MVAFRDRGTGRGPAGGVMVTGRGATRGWRTGASVAVAALGVGAVGGCGCESDFRLLQGEIESCFEAEWRCCQRIAESDPEAGIACFDELRERRRRLSELLLQWFEACRSSERDVARDLGRLIRGMLLAGGCGDGPVRRLVDGRTVTAGVPFGGFDEISLRWELPVASSGGRTEARLAGRAVPIRLGDREATVLASGRMAIVVDPSGRTGPTVTGFELDLAVRTGPDGAPGAPQVSLRLLRDDRFPGRVVLRDGRERLGFLVEVIDGREPWPLPRRLWMEWPLVRDHATIVVGGESMRLWDLIPPDPGIADWNGDARIDAVDIAAFLATPEARRDLDLDGAATAKDFVRFLESWSLRCERPAR